VTQASERDLDIVANAVLDMTIYYGRLYVATDSGLYHLDIDWNDDSDLGRDPPERRFDWSCLSTLVGFGAVGTSCGEEGLFCAFDEFGWSLNRPKHQKKIADRSLRAQWLGHNLVNYATSDAPTFLRSSSERVASNLERTPDDERERFMLTDVESVASDFDAFFELIGGRFGVHKDSVQFTYNSSGYAFAHTVEGDFYSLKMNVSEEGRIKVGVAHTYKGAGTRIFSVNPSGAGLVIETDDRVLLFSNGEWLPIVESEVMSVRTFPRSRRYGNLVAVTNEDGLLLASLFDDSLLSIQTSR
jgi:hypothetical protein